MKRYLWPLVIFCSAVAAIITAASSSQTPIRELFTFWFLLVCPGMAFVRLFHFKDKLAEWVLAIALSIAIDVIVSEFAVLNRLWSLPGMVNILVAISVIGALIQILMIVFQNRKQVSNEFDRNRALE